ncbi:beta strand repeat-containing protein [Parabacteroides sp.]
MHKISILLSLLSLLFSFSLRADNITLDISRGSITITNSGYTQNGQSGNFPGEGSCFIITQSNKETATNNTITVSSGTQNITLKGVNISVNDASAFSIATGAEVNLTLEEENKLSSGSNYAGLQVPGENNASAKLTITAESTGSLTTQGGFYGAGIGGYKNGSTRFSGGIITINGGIITATGGTYGAGIGGAYYGDGGTITINGGKVTANGGWMGGAGIGGGSGDTSGGSGGTITINGGVISAKGASGNFGYQGAGIGGGDGCDGGTITITGGFITATSGGNDAAGIGGGRKSSDGSGGGSGTFSTGDTGNAVIIASSIQDNTNMSGWKGIFFTDSNSKEGTIKGSPVTITTDTQIPEGYTLAIGSGESLIIADGATLTNEGTITNSGTLTNNGILQNNSTITNSGTISGNNKITPALTLNVSEGSTSYGGSALEATYTYNGDGTLSISSSDIASGTIDTNNKKITLTPTAAGTATITLSAAVGSLYGTASATYALTVNKIAPAATLFAYTAPANTTYDGNAKTATVKANDDIAGMGSLTLSYYKDGTKVDAPTTPGTYTIKISVADDGTNYTATTAGSELTADGWAFAISPKAITLAPDANQVLYQDEAPAYTFDDSQLITGDEITFTGTLTVDNSSGSSTIKAGSLALAGAAKDNYTLSVTETACTYKGQSPSSIDIDKTDLTGSWHTAAVTLTAPEDFLIGLSETGTFSRTVEYNEEGISCTYYLQRVNRTEVYKHTADIQIDLTAPEVKVETRDLAYTITSSDGTSGIGSVTLDGNPIPDEDAIATLSDEKVFTGNSTAGKHTLVVTDVAGNSTTKEFSLSDPTPPTPPTPPEPSPDPDPSPTVFYTVALPFVEGAVTDPVAGSYEVASWDSFRFYLTLAEGYDLSQPVVTTSLGELLEPRSSDGAYIIKYVRSDVEIRIDGIVKNPDAVANATIESGNRVWVNEHRLFIRTDNPANVRIYTFEGNLCKAFRSDGGEQEVSLASGAYIIRIGGDSFKVVL